MRIPCIQRRTKEGFKKNAFPSRLPHPLVFRAPNPGKESFPCPGFGKAKLRKKRVPRKKRLQCLPSKKIRVCLDMSRPEKLCPPQQPSARKSRPVVDRTHPIRFILSGKNPRRYSPGAQPQPNKPSFSPARSAASKTKKPVLLDRLPAKTKTIVCSSKKARLPGKAAWILPASFPVQPCSPKRNVT